MMTNEADVASPLDLATEIESYYPMAGKVDKYSVAYRLNSDGGIHVVLEVEQACVEKLCQKMNLVFNVKAYGPLLDNTHTHVSS